MDRRRIYLLRHGEVAYYADPSRPVQHEEVVLTGAGREQARAAGRALAKVRFDRVVTTGLRRTTETAQLVIAQLDQPPAQAEFEVVPDFAELRAGDVSLIPDEEIEEAYLAAWRRAAPRDASFLRGETIGSLVDRVGAAFERLLADAGWHTILVVAHGGVNRAILSLLLAGPGTFFGHLEQSPGCVNIVDCGPDLVVRAVNVTPYDPAQLGRRITTLEDMLEQYREYRGGAA